jgi:bacteriocin-like protein
MSKDQSNHKRPVKDELQDDELNQVTGGSKSFSYGGLSVQYKPQDNKGGD